MPVLNVCPTISSIILHASLHVPLPLLPKMAFALLVHLIVSIATLSPVKTAPIVLSFTKEYV